MPQPWRPYEIARARQMREEGIEYAAIGVELGRSTESVRRKIYYLDNYVLTEVPREQPQHSFVIPSHVIEDRDRRMSLVPHDLTALLMGDPIR